MSLKQNIKTLYSKLLPVLLCFIILSNLSFSVFHIESEEHLHINHNCAPNEEVNACHRFLTHNEKSAECNGEHEHVTNKTDDCFICKYHKQRNEFFVFQECSLVHLRDYQLSYKSIVFTNKIQNYTSLYLRGPPYFNA